METGLLIVIAEHYNNCNQDVTITLYSLIQNTIAYSGYTIAYSGYFVYTLSALRATILHYCSAPFRRKEKGS